MTLPLGLGEHHFKDFKTNTTMLRDSFYQGKLWTFYQLEWPILQTEWTSERTFSKAQIYTTQEAVFSNHLDFSIWGLIHDQRQ